MVDDVILKCRVSSSDPSINCTGNDGHNENAFEESSEHPNALSFSGRLSQTSLLKLFIGK